MSLVCFIFTDKLIKKCVSFCKEIEDLEAQHGYLNLSEALSVLTYKHKETSGRICRDKHKQKKFERQI